LQIRRNDSQAWRNNFKAGRNENQIQRNKIQIQDHAFSNTLREIRRIFYAAPVLPSPLEPLLRRCDLHTIISDFRKAIVVDKSKSATQVSLRRPEA
jgi:hypothetical protein